jgi:hypothetical protein
MKLLKQVFSWGMHALKKLILWVLHYILALFLIPNPRKVEYLGYKYLFSLKEVEYRPLGDSRGEYILRCAKNRMSPWRSHEELVELVRKINNGCGLWQKLYGGNPNWG